MKPESKKNCNKSTNKSEDNTASPSCFDLTVLSQALEVQAAENNNKDKSSFDLSNISEALNNVAKKENKKKMKRLEVIRSIARLQEEVKMRQLRARRLRYICETWRTGKMAGWRVHEQRSCSPIPIFSLGDRRRVRVKYRYVQKRIAEEVVDAS